MCRALCSPPRPTPCKLVSEPRKPSEGPSPATGCTPPWGWTGLGLPLGVVGSLSPAHHPGELSGPVSTLGPSPHRTRRPGRPAHNSTGCAPAPGEGCGDGGWGMGCSTLQGPEHQLHSETAPKPENSLLQRYKSVTAEMYSNKLSGGPGAGAGAGHAPYGQGPPHRVSSQ